jgi:hypothetical protein
MAGWGFVDPGSGIADRAGRTKRYGLARNVTPGNRGLAPAKNANTFAATPCRAEACGLSIALAEVNGRRAAGMVSKEKLERLIDRAMNQPTDWQQSKIDVGAVARNAQIRHTAAMLEQLGYGALVAELLRLEKQRLQQNPVSELPAA